MLNLETMILKLDQILIPVFIKMIEYMLTNMK